MLARFRQILATRRNLRAHFWQTAANYVQQVFGVAFGIILARLLDPADFGHFAFASATIGLFVLPAAWSLAPQIVAEGAKNPTIVSDAIRFSRKIVFARLVLVGVGCAWIFLREGPALGWIAIGIAVPTALSEFVAVFRASLEARGEFKGNFYDSILTVAVSMGIAVPAALCGAGVWALVMPAVPLFCCQWVLFTRLTGLRLKPHYPPSGKSYLRSGLALWLAGTGDQALMRIDKFFLGKYAAADVLGNYNRAFNYAPLSARILNSLLTNPTVTALATAANPSARIRLLAKTSALLLAGGVGNFALWWWLADPIVPFVFGEQWRPAIPVFRAMAPMGLVISFAYLPTTLLLADRRYVALASGRIASLILFVVVCICFTPTLNAERMAWLFQSALIFQGTIFILASLLTRGKRSARPTA